MARTAQRRVTHPRTRVASAQVLAREARIARAQTQRRRLVLATLAVLTLIALGLNLRWASANVSGDVQLFECYAHAFWQGANGPHVGQVPGCVSDVTQAFHAFPREYPAPALALFSLPLLMPWWSFVVAFALCIAVLVAIVTVVLARQGTLEATIAFPLYVLVAGWFFALERYDILPGLCVLLALVSIDRGHLRAATLALAAGTLLKGFPIALFPLVLIAGKRGEQGSWRFDLVGIYIAICAAGFAPALLLNASGALAPVHYELARSLHIESVAGSLFWYASQNGLGSAPYTPGGPTVGTTYSVDVLGGSQFAWELFFGIAGIAGVLYAYWRSWRGWDSAGRGFVVVLLCVLLAGKVFSTQYLLWILPVAAYVEGVRFRWLILCILTSAIIDSYYTRTVQLAALPMEQHFIGLIVVRNLLICGLTMLYLLTPGDRRARRWPTRPAWRYIWEDYLMAAP
jgi:hypothetical protein